MAFSFSFAFPDSLSLNSPSGFSYLSPRIHAGTCDRVTCCDCDTIEQALQKHIDDNFDEGTKAVGRDLLHSLMDANIDHNLLDTVLARGDTDRYMTHIADAVEQAAIDMAGITDPKLAKPYRGRSRLCTAPGPPTQKRYLAPDNTVLGLSLIHI